MHLLTYGQTDRGRQRSRNEDMFLVDDIQRVYAVADGLGGLPRGALASNLAISSLEEFLRRAPPGELDYPGLFNFINLRVYQEGRQVSVEMGIGTTLTVVKVLEGEIVVGHVGDCSLFRFRDNRWEQLTTDHTMEQELRSRLAPGENVYIPEYFTHTLTRCLGQGEEVEPDVYRHPIFKGDRFLLCSDGVTKTLTPAELHAQARAADHPEVLVEELIRIGNDRGGPDNITAIAVFVA